MKSYDMFVTHELNPGEKYDFFLFAPHTGFDPIWIPYIKKSIKDNVFSDEILCQYMKHEADIGAREITLGIFENIHTHDPSIKLCMILGCVPRAFCDINNDIFRACPDRTDRNMWAHICNTTLREIEGHIVRSKYGIHIHTMNGRSLVNNWQFDNQKTEKDMIDFLESGYSEIFRNDNILTHTTSGEYHSYSELDRFLIQYWEQNHIILDQNIAYSFQEHFTATHLISKVPSSLIEKTKSNISIDVTKDCINSSNIVLDMNKIRRYTTIITYAIIDFLYSRIS